MALPLLDPSDLERFSLVLNGAPLTITGDQTGTASAANPSGLRLAGGSLFRDYTPWTEQEINDFSQGMGHEKIGENGFLWNELDTSEGNEVRLPPLNSTQTISTVTVPDATISVWNSTEIWESKIIEASNGKLYAFRGFYIYECDPAVNTWAVWLDVRGTVFHANHQALRQSYIIDMCEFNNCLIIVTTPFFRTTEPGGGLNPPLITEFGVNVGSTTAGFVAYPNVFSVNLADKFPAAVSWGTQVTLPLQSGDTGDTGLAGTNFPPSMLCATACHAFSGYLFIGGSGGYAYSAGTENNPTLWEFEGQQVGFFGGIGAGTAVRFPSPLNLSTKLGGRRWVTGFAGVQGQTIGEFYVYMTTTEGLYLCDMAIPTLVKVMAYDGESPYNGRGIITHQNDIYIPIYRSLSNATIVGGDVIRFTQSGQRVNVGLDQTPVNPVVGVDTPYTNYATITTTLRMATSPTTLIAGLYIAGLDSAMAGSTQVMPRVAGLKGQGWHALNARHLESGTTFTQVGGIHYHSGTQNVYYMLSGAKATGPLDLYFQRFIYPDSNKATYSYDGAGYLWLGWFDAGSPLLSKDWHSISVYGECLDDDDHQVRVFYEVSDTIPDCGVYTQLPLMNPSFTYGTDTIDGEYVLPGTMDDCVIPRSGRYIGVTLYMNTADTSSTPVVRGLKLKYFTPIGDYFRFSYSVKLPKDCLVDGCGEKLEEYDQALWDQALREAACSIEPVPFRDIDGKWYLVRVESESRRIEKVDFSSSPPYRTFDITWNLVFIQVMNPTICDESWMAAAC